MLRFCLQNRLIPIKNVLQTPACQTITSNIRLLNYNKPNLSRHFCTKINEDNKLEQVYYGPLTPQIKGVKVFSLSSSVAGLIAQPIIIREAAAIGSTSLIVALCSVVGFFTFVTPLLLHIITKKYVTEVHYNRTTSKYRATTINFFLLPKVLEFSPDDVVVPDVPGMFTTMIAKGRPLFIEARHFNDPMHYARIMGYDKPMDFKLGQIENDESK